MNGQQGTVRGRQEAVEEYVRLSEIASLVEAPRWAQEAIQFFEEGFTFDFSLTIHTEIRKHGTKAK